MKLSLILFLSFLLHTEVVSQELSAAHKDSVRSIIDQYYSLNLKVFQKNSTKEDIDALFSLFTDDFVYVHPKYGGEYSRGDIYEGYMNNQRKGSYNGSIANVKVKNIIIGLNAAAVDRVYLQKTSSGELKEVDEGMTLFEIRNGKISKIFEYW